MHAPYLLALRDPRVVCTRLYSYPTLVAEAGKKEEEEEEDEGGDKDGMGKGAEVLNPYPLASVWASKTEQNLSVA